MSAAPDPLARHRVRHEPSYQPRGDEIALFEAAHARRLPLVIKGPAGCGKTRFVEHMAWRLRRPLVTVACHEDLAVADLVGRWRPEGGGPSWQDGPLALAARRGAICHLDELARASAGTAVAVHPLTDTRRMLAIAARGEIVPAHPDFHLVVSHTPTPGVAEMKPATRQRFCTLEFGYPEPEQEARIVMRESGLDVERASDIVAFGRRTRRLEGAGLDEGASTRMLVHAAALVVQGLPPGAACRLAMVEVLGGDAGVTEALQFALEASF